MRILIYIVFMGSLFLSGCVDPDPESNLERENPVFKRVLDAHGGYDTWTKMGTLIFTMTSDGESETHTIDLKSRKVRIEAGDRYTLGFDGMNVWVTPDIDSFPGDSPRFYHNLHFYFAAIPFVFMDPGVTVKYLGEQKFEENKYLVLMATFGEQIGDSAEDQYIMYIDPESYLINFILYSVTFFDETQANSYNALVYFWKRVEGLTFPYQYGGYHWNNGTFGEPRYAVTFSNVQFLEERKNDSLFKAPDTAYIEPK